MCSTHAIAAQCPANLPAGVVLRVLPDEKLTAGLSAGPTILTVSSDIRFFPNRPPLLARGSKILGNIVESKQAGRFWGKARLQLSLTSILTSDFCEYPISGKIVEVDRRKNKVKVHDDTIYARGHAKRDLIALLFPPTTIYQLLRMPARGPKLIVDNETPIIIKLMEPVSLVEPNEPTERLGALRSKLDQMERELSTFKASVTQASRPPEQQAVSSAAGPCSTTEFSTARPLVQSNAVVRPVRNLTPYHVSIYLDRRPVTVLPPCYGPSMISTPTTEFKLEASASLLTTAGQKQIAVKIVPSASGNGWDILPTPEEPVVLTAN
jgi:hypothetical protein